MDEEDTARALKDLQTAIEESRELRRKLVWGGAEDERFADAWVRGWEECVTAFAVVFENLGAQRGATWVDVLTRIEACRASLPRSLNPRVLELAHTALDDLWGAATAGLQGERDLAATHAVEARRKAAVLGGLLGN